MITDDDSGEKGWSQPRAVNRQKLQSNTEIPMHAGMFQNDRQ